MWIPTLIVAIGDKSIRPICAISESELADISSVSLSQIFVSRRRSKRNGRGGERGSIPRRIGTLSASLRHAGHAVVHYARVYVYMYRCDVERRSACGGQPPPPSSSTPSPALPVWWIKLTSARESKRKEGDVTSRLRRIKTSESHESALSTYAARRRGEGVIGGEGKNRSPPPAHVYREVRLGCSRDRAG